MPELLKKEGMIEFWKKMTRRFALDVPFILAQLEALSKHHTETVYKDNVFDRLVCPVLLLDTERREGFGLRAFEGLKQRFPKASSQVMEGCGHLAFLVKGQDVAQVVLKWMTKTYWSNMEDNL